MPSGNDGIQAAWMPSLASRQLLLCTLPPASLQSWIPAIHAGMTKLKGIGQINNHTIFNEIIKIKNYLSTVPNRYEITYSTAQCRCTDLQYVFLRRYQLTYPVLPC
jgi:hypothetical protein